MSKQLALPPLTLASAVTADNGAPSIGVAAQGTLTIVGGANASDGEKVAIGGVDYTWVDALTTPKSLPREVLIGADADASRDNLIAVIHDNLYPDEFVSVAAGTDETAATETLTFTGNALNTETVTINGKAYTFQTVLTDSDGNVLIGASASDSLDNLIAAITLGAGAGTLYATSTTLHPTVTAAAGAGDTMDATAKTPGAAGNALTLATDVTGASWGGATMSGGLDTTMIATAKTVGTAGNAITTTETMTSGSWDAATLGTTVAGVNRDGIRLIDLLAGDKHKPSKFDLEIVITGTGAQSADAYLWGYRDAGLNGNAGEYARLGVGSDAGHVNEGIAISGTTKAVFRRTLQNIGYLDDVYLEVLNKSGAGFSLSASLTPIFEMPQG